MTASPATRPRQRPGNVIALNALTPQQPEEKSVLTEEFETFYREHSSYVAHNLRRLGVRRADVDDVAQDVFVAVHRRFGEYDRARSARAWLFSFIGGTAANYRRLVRHERERDLEEESLSTDADNPESNAYRAAQLRLIRDVLLSMSDERRTALIMHDLDGLTAPEIAHALEVPLNTVYSRVRRARADFKRIAQTRMPGDGQ